MCGIAAVFGSAPAHRIHALVDGMLQVQAHRGPDGDGIWRSAVHGVQDGLGLRRLKVLDLSDASNQPMVTEDGRFVLIYNGEIYNYKELRKELIFAGLRFRTTGDTEVVLSAIIHWGTDAFSKFNGMWALVLLDTVRGTVLISRDRFGIKPLYICDTDHIMYISSEIKEISESRPEGSRSLQVS